jgi:transglutaminase-like putative cysteine protease
VSADARSGVAVGPVDVDFRLAALAGTALLTASYGSVLHHVTDVAGGSRLMLGVLVGTAVLALWVGRVLRPRTAAFLTALLVVGGGTVYFLAVPASQRALISVGRLTSDTVALLTGLSVLRLTRANVWALSIAPTPVFFSWYLVTRRRYAAGAAVGLGTLGLFVLTGDAEGVAVVVGVVGAAAAVGFGTLDRYGGTRAQVETLAILLAVTVVAAAVASAVPAAALGVGATGGPVLPDRTSPTGQASLVDSTDELEVVGSIRLSPQVQFVVESQQGTYWQTAAYDRYTGSGWVRSGDAQLYDGPRSGPPGDARTVRHSVTARTELGSMPAAWKPVTVSGMAPSRVAVTPDGSLRPVSTIDPGESYAVTSRVARASAERRRAAGTDYPDRVRERYTQLPASTPDRVERRTAEVTADADSPAAAAAAVESYLESNKRYSLSVRQPEGQVADTFLFEMDAGYCTYYATTMVTMLRTQGIPARFVTGYTTGQQVDDDRWVVRGLDSHAWVQVYLPDVGWVRYDPTPAGPRRTAEQGRLVEARESGESGVDAAGSDEPTPTPTPTPTPESDGGADPAAPTTGTATAAPEATTPGAGSDPTGADGRRLPDPPPPETLALWLVVLGGVAAVASRTGAVGRLRRAVWLRRRGPRRDPDADAVRAFERLSYLLARQERPRRPGETPRAYVAALAEDERADLIRRTYERARYGDGVDRAAADAATDAVGELVRERTLPTRPFVDDGSEAGRPDTV